MNKKIVAYKKYFNQKNCIITGASSGIGRLLAITLASYGANLVLVARRQEMLENVAEECRKAARIEHKEAGNKVHEGEDCVARQENKIYVCCADIYVCCADISTCDGATQVYDFVQARFDRVDILVANSGASMHAKISESSEVVYHKMLNSNYFTIVHMTLKFLPMLLASKGILAAVTSIQSLIGVTYHAAYVAAKHAAGGFLEALELEEPDLSIVEIMPGWVSGTDIRSSAIDGYGNLIEQRSSHKRHSRSSITIEECVSALVEGMFKRQRLVYRPKLWKNILFVKYSMRNYLHNLIKGRESFSSSS